jgi:predicted metal-binding protein
MPVSQGAVKPGPGDGRGRAGYQFLEDLATAHWRSEVLFAALELDIFARLGREDFSPERLAQAMGWDAEALGRLLEALGEMGLLVKAEGRFANGPFAAGHLLPGGADYLGDFLAYRRYIAPHWKRLPARVREGPAANLRPTDESGQVYQERVAAYVRALDAQARLKARQAVEHLGLLLDQPPTDILDLGGGAGAWCRAALARWPQARALLLDLPEVLAAASRLRPLDEDWIRVERAPGDCRSPELWQGLADRRFDLIFLSNLLHAYGPDEARDILGQAAMALSPGGALVIHDYITEEPGGDPLKGRLYDLHMLLNTYNGRIHSLQSLGAGLAAAGLPGWRLINLTGDTAIIVAQAGQEGWASLDNQDLLILRARELGFGQAALIQTQDVAVEPWVRLKCRNGCPRYGKGLQCPPHSPDDKEMARILGSYEQALLVRGTPPGKEFHQRLLALERRCFLAGYHKALAFGAGPCTLCDQCDVSAPCRQPDRSRPSMEACGVDVYETVRQAGWTLEPVQDREGYVKFFGLLLLQ